MLLLNGKEVSKETGFKDVLTELGKTFPQYTFHEVWKNSEVTKNTGRKHGP